jgi:hypothetical protein
MKCFVNGSARRFLLVAIIICAPGANACTKEEAFGFHFGKSVPSGAVDVKEYYFMGGTGPGNVLRSFQASVPSPMENFPHYAYWSNRDRKAVNSIVAFRQLISDKKLLNDEAYRTAVLEKVRVEIAQLRDLWQKMYGITYVSTTPSGLTWDGENAEVSSTIGTFGGEYLYVECTNKALRQEAEQMAWKSWLGK